MVVKLCVEWVLHEYCVGVGTMSNNDVVHSMSLVLGMSHLEIFVVMDVTDGE